MTSHPACCTLSLMASLRTELEKTDICFQHQNLKLFWNFFYSDLPGLRQLYWRWSSHINGVFSPFWIGFLFDLSSRELPEHRYRLSSGKHSLLFSIFHSLFRLVVNGVIFAGVDTWLFCALRAEGAKIRSEFQSEQSSRSWSCSLLFPIFYSLFPFPIFHSLFWLVVTWRHFRWNPHVSLSCLAYRESAESQSVQSSRGDNRSLFSHSSSPMRTRIE